ncbi:RAMP superfamily protein [uncultured archaeon]|nr:RAMP superfamily protein [uncultured archaeon]
MHKERHNNLELGIRLTPRSPLLIKSSGISPNPSLPDMQFVRTFVKGIETIYIPGASLKGVFRSYVEKILRTKKGIDGACDIFDKGKTCAKETEKELPGNEIYKNSCLACKMFGSTKLKSRISFIDAYPSGEIKTETRYGVAISRLTHAVAQGPFDMEVAVSGSFNSKIYLENFELWQLGALALAIRGLNDGLIRIGFGKNRGFGEVAVNIETIQFTFSSELPEKEICGIGKIVSEDAANKYGLVGNDIIIIESNPSKTENEIIYTKREYSPKSWEEISNKAISQLKGILS